VALLQPKKDFYYEAHPEPEDILLVVEVSDTSLNRDRTVKADLYAETGIAGYWVLDVRVPIVHSDLKNGIYESVLPAGVVKASV
jgi:Putative restriction endonuclease